MQRESPGEADTMADVGGVELGETFADPSGSGSGTERGAKPKPNAGPERGSLIGRFVVLDILGTGGMGVVYAGYDPDLDRKVAIKLLRTQVMASDEARLRLLREAQAMARIDHPNVIRVHEAGTHSDQIYIAMEFASGGTLRQWLAASRRTMREIMRVFAQAGRGLAAAHAAGLVHRDFKPDNVLLLADGVARVTDFGLVGVVGDQPAPRPSALEVPLSDSTPLSQDLTRTGALMGTPAFMAPEQFQGGLVGPAADQFAFCVALYEALYGVQPFEGDTFAELCANVVGGKVSAQRNSDVPSRIRRVILRGLETDPAKRYPTMDHLISELDREPKRRTRAIALGGVGVVAAGAIALVAMRPGASAQCTGAEARLAIAWSPIQHGKLSQAFEAVNRPLAHAELDRVVAIVDRWGQAWQQAYVGACEDTRVRRIQSEHLLDLRMECLMRRLDEARATLDLLAIGGGDAIDHALDAVRALPSVTPCADTAALTAAIAPPATEEARQAVAAIRGKIDQARAQRKLGRYPAALAIARGALDDARTRGYAPVTAEALYEVGKLQNLLADRAAADTLGEAMRLAASVGDTDVTIRAAAVRVVAFTTQPARFAVADEIGQFADAIATHAPPSAEAMVALDGAVGQLLVKERHLDQAQVRYDHALALATAQLGADDPATIKTIGLLALLAIARHKYEDSRRLFEQVLAAEQRIAGPNHPDVATALDNVANGYYDQGKYPESKQLHEQALAIRIAALGPDHPAVAHSYNNIGGFYAASGDNLTAKTYYDKALAVYRKAYGDDSVELTDALVNLGGSLQALGDRNGARSVDERARALLEKAYTADDPRVAPVLSDLGVIARDDRRFDEAIELFQHAEQIMEKAYGANDPDAIDYMGNLANTYTEMGKLSEAREMTSRTMSAMAAVYGPDHPRMGAVLGNYGFLQLKLEDPKGALASFQKAVEIFEAKLGKTHPNVAFVLTGEAEALIRLKRNDEAVPILERALAIGTAAHIAPNQLGELHFYLADALVANPTTRVRARAEAKLALDGYEQAHDKSDAELTKRWLRKH